MVWGLARVSNAVTVHGMSVDPDQSRKDPEPASGNRPQDASPNRTRANVAVAIITVALVAGGIWLAHLLADMRRVQDCVMSGRTNCAPIEGATGQ